MKTQSSPCRGWGQGALWCVVLIALGVLVACNRKNDPNPTVETLGDAKTAPMGANSANPAPAMPVSGTDRVFVVEAAASGLAEVEGGRLGAEKSRDAAVKAYAQQLVTEHTAANDELKRIAGAKGITVLNALDEAGKFQLDKLRNAPDEGFDALFVQTLGIDAHTKAIQLFETQAREGQDAELRRFAEQLLPKLREHLAIAQQLHTRIAKR